MIPKGLFTQLAMVVLSIGIIITYVKPAFADIGRVQDDIAIYSNKRAEVATVNDELQKLATKLNNISRDDQNKLNTYLPNTVDYIAVPRDLLFIVLQSGALYRDVSYKGALEKKTNSKNQDVSTSLPLSHSFLLSVEGTYEQIKSLFRLMEQNNYPLEVDSLDIQVIEGGFLSLDMTLITYSYQEPGVANKIVF